MQFSKRLWVRSTKSWVRSSMTVWRNGKDMLHTHTRPQTLLIGIGLECTAMLDEFPEILYRLQDGPAIDLLNIHPHDVKRNGFTGT